MLKYKEKSKMPSDLCQVTCVDSVPYLQCTFLELLSWCLVSWFWWSDMFSSLGEKFVLINVVGIVEDWSFIGESIPSWKSIHLDTIISIVKKNMVQSKLEPNKLWLFLPFQPNFKSQPHLPNNPKEQTFRVNQVKVNLR